MNGQGAARVKKKRGPAPTGQGQVISIRLHPDLLGPLDAWIEKQPDPKPSRSDAVRLFLREALESGGLKV